MLAFIIWSILSLIIIIFGIICMISKTQKQFGFWANTEKIPVTDVKGYNRALGKLFIVFGIVLEIMGLPILAGENSPWAIVSILGIMFLAITTMIIYVLIIEPKYKKK